MILEYESLSLFGSTVTCVGMVVPSPSRGGSGWGWGKMIGQTNKPVMKNKLQCKLRYNMTDAEQLLWRALRNRQMGGYKFRRQHPFNDFILDFVCLEKRLVLEIDGGQHAERQVPDDIRTKKLIGAGFCVLRFWNHEVLGQIEAVKERIWQELKGPGEPHPHLNPLPEGEESN